MYDFAMHEFMLQAMQVSALLHYIIIKKKKIV